jgi:hypothetical protein
VTICGDVLLAATLTTVIAHNMTPTEIDALADEIMQDTLMAEADAYEEAVGLYPSLYLVAQNWDFDALAQGNDAAAF